jgi:hypothetical protein
MSWKFWGSISCKWQEIFICSMQPDQLWHLHILLLVVPRALSVQVYQPEQDAGLSSPSSSAVKNECSHTSTPLHALMTCTGTMLPLPFAIHARKQPKLSGSSPTRMYCSVTEQNEMFINTVHCSFLRINTM